MRRKINPTHRILSVILAIAVIMSMVPVSVSVFAALPSTLTTDIGEKDFVVGETTEFTFTTTANDDAGTAVLGSFVFSDPDAIEKLEYRESKDGNWYEFYGDFGPAEGFPLTNATSQFRVTFKKVGTYTLNAYMKKVEGGDVLCSSETTIVVNGHSELTTDIDQKVFVVDESTEFSFTTMANEDAGELVRGSFEFSDSDAIKTLEYRESKDGNWYSFNGDFGPESGFPLTDNATSYFRATFNKAGVYTLKAYMKKTDGEVLCFTVAQVVVKARSEISFAEENVEIKYSDVNATNDTLVDSVSGAEYTYKSDDENIVKVSEYGILTPVGIGETTITVTRKENAGYMSSSAAYTVTVVPGEQDALTWEKTVPDSIAWNDEAGYSNTVKGGSGDGAVSYSSSDVTIAEVDQTSGVVTLKKPGTVTVTATKSGNGLYEDQTATYVLVVAKAEQKPIGFANANPEAIYYGETYTNVATGGSTDGKIKYESSDETVATVDENGVVTALKQGIVTITATLEGDELYNDTVPATYTLTVYRATQKTELHFAKGTVGQKIKYGVTDYANVASGGDTGPISYSSSDKTVATVDENGVVTTLKAGTVTITATVPQTEQYEAQTISYELVIEHADQEVTFENGNVNIPAITYGDSYSNKATAITAITYTSSDETIAKVVDDEGTLNIFKAGTVTITATAEGTEQYNEASASYTITINKAAQEIIFDNGKTPTVQFNDNDNAYVNSSSSVQQGNVPCTYSVAGGESLISDFNEDTGAFKIIKAGTVIISVAYDSTDCYKTASSSYALTITPDDQEIAFPQNAYTIVSGHDFDEADMPVASVVGTLFGEGDITYAIKDNQDEAGIVKSLDAATGVIALTYNTGSVTIVATKAADNNYKDATAEYTLTVNAWEPGEETYELVDDKGDSVNEWFDGNVSVKAKEGYLVSLKNTKDEADWKTELSDLVTEDGDNNVIEFYVKNADGDISAICQETVKKDTVVPEISITKDAPSVMSKFLEIITVGLWKQDTVTFEIVSDDMTSGVASVEYYVDTTSTTKMTQEQLESVAVWTTYAAPITVAKDSQFVVYAKVTDNAGNYTYNTTEGIIFDANLPDVTITPSDSNDFADDYYTGDVIFDISAMDAAPSSGISTIDYKVEVNGTTTQEGNLYTFVEDEEAFLRSEWSKDAAIIVDSTDRVETDKVVLSVTAVDQSGNVNTETYEMAILSLPAGISVETISGYHTGSVSSKITVSGRPASFKAENVILNITAKNFTGNAVEAKYQISDWTKVGEDYEATVTFYDNANYVFSVTYQDPGENGLSGTSNSISFTVDEDLPAGKITVNDTTVWESLLETLTFGLWTNDAVTITASASDVTSGVANIEYYKTDDKTAKSTNELELVEWTTYTAPITVSEDEVFVIYLKLTDKAGKVNYISTDGYIVEKTAAGLTLEPDTPNENGVYNKDVNIAVDVNENEFYSGIKSVEYWVTCDDEETQREMLYSFDTVNPTYEQLESTWDGIFTVEAKKNNSDNVVAYVQVTDNAGNVVTKEVKLRIDITEPTINVKFDNNVANVVDGRGYFDSNRVATITIKERTSNFDKDKATESILFTGVNRAGDNVSLDRVAMIGDWETVEGNTPDEATHTARVYFTTDANYDFTLSYEDQAGNECTYEEVVFEDGTITPRFFTVDKLDPKATVTVETSTWDKLIEVLTFGLWTKETVTVSATEEDVTSPVTIEYYKTADVTALNKEDLNKVTEWQPFEGLEITEDERLVVYLKVTDHAGNYIYISSDGYIVDKSKAEIMLKPDDTELSHNGINLYNTDVNVLIDVQEKKDDSYSGLKEVEYWVVKDGKEETQRETLFAFDKEAPIYEELVSSFTKTVTISADKNNSCDVVLYVKVTDNAGNVIQDSVAVDIDKTAPVIDVSYDNNSPYKTVDDKAYFPASRNATVVITERSAHFNAAEATKGITIIAVDAEGNAVIEDCSTLISDWSTVEGADANDATHTATIDYSADANYTFEIHYTDLAKNDNEPVNTGDAVTPYVFAVDTTKPTGTVTAGNLGTWDTLIEILTFGLWSKDTVDVTGTTDDATTPIESVSYYKTDDTTAKTWEQLSEITEWEDFDGLTIPADEKFTVYIRIVDFAGNVEFISTNGVIVDDELPAIEAIKPEITISPVQPINGFYDSDVDVAVKVTDPIFGETEAYAGLKEIRYEIYNMGNKTQDGILYAFDVQDPTHAQLLQVWEKMDAIKVNAALNNSNDVEIKVYAVDNAGNSSEASCKIMIDTTNPTIEVRYDNNDGDTTFTDGVFFKANRTATIIVTERNFNPELVKLEITNSDGYVPVLSGWTMEAGTNNGDNTLHIATVVFDRDGDYTFDISCEDMAGRANESVDYGNSLAPQKFTVDKTIPLVNVTYDNTSALNGNYYKAQRVATITVTEHNFETSRIVIKLNATDDGVESSLPTVSNWSSRGDVHTATITYAADSLYTFDFEYNDKAGNAAADIAEQRFYVDKTAPEVEISGIVDESANNADGNIGFVITATDTNFDVFTPVLTAVIRNGDAFETKQLDLGEVTDIKNGKVYTVTNMDADGIYRITCTVVDKAGNAYTAVTLQNTEGEQYVENRNGNDTLVVFSVNRDGSTFEISEETIGVVDQYYIQNVENDIIIVETNVDPLQEYTVTLNGKELTKDTDYTVKEESGEGAWKKYTYTVNKELFADEGEYKLVVSSKDKAENDAFSDVKDATVNFVVDRTAPIITITGLATDGRYQVEKQTVTLIPTDDGGALNSLIVRLVDEDGKELKELINLSGEALEEALANGSGQIVFKIAEGLYQNVQIICNDCAVDAEGNTNTYDETFTNVSVSSSAIMIFWANKPLRWGIIGGVSAVLIALIVFIILKTKKRKEDK